jgi:hypothetical protein
MTLPGDRFAVEPRDAFHVGRFQYLDRVGHHLLAHATLVVSIGHRDIEGRHAPRVRARARTSRPGVLTAQTHTTLASAFEFEGVRYRPTLERIPSEANLRRARKQLEEIKQRISRGQSSFADEFPDYKFLGHVAKVVTPRTCNDVFDDFMAHCESRMSKNDLSFATFESYRRILKSTWRPEIGEEIFEDVKYSRLAKIVDGKKGINKETHNNIVSVIRCAVEYGYRDYPEKHNPASALKCFRLFKKDRRQPDPFTI